MGANHIKLSYTLIIMSSMNAHPLPPGPRQLEEGSDRIALLFGVTSWIKTFSLLLIHWANLQELLVVLIWTKNKAKTKRKISRSEDTPMAVSLSAISSCRESWKPHDLLMLCFSLLWCSLVWHLELHPWHCDWSFLYSTTRRDPGYVARRETLHVMGEAKGIVLIWLRG